MLTTGRSTSTKIRCEEVLKHYRYQVFNAITVRWIEGVVGIKSIQRKNVCIGRLRTYNVSYLPGKGIVLL
jgi:hypothetical protein